MGFFEEIDEPIEVLAVFKTGSMKPIRFRWNSHTHHVLKVTGHWTTHVGESKQYYYSVVGESQDYFEIVLDSRTLGWRLARVCLEG